MLVKKSSKVHKSCMFSSDKRLPDKAIKEIHDSDHEFTCKWNSAVNVKIFISSALKTETILSAHNEQAWNTVQKKNLAIKIDL